jgi:hypothetical protein
MVAMQRTVTSWSQFQQHWCAPLNFLLAGECLPFRYQPPPLGEVVAAMRGLSASRLRAGAPSPHLRLDAGPPGFLEMPVDEALKTCFVLANFALKDHYDGIFRGLKEGFVEPWEQALATRGFTWHNSFPILFISGPGASTSYHMDRSFVLAWQVTGSKRFAGLRDPNKWAPKDIRLNHVTGQMMRPEGLTEADALVYEMPPGTALWNSILTPHWVDAMDGQPAMTLSLVMQGLRYQGQLSPYEAEYFAHSGHFGG